MSLLPRIPCRKLFIDSRFALPGGTSTEFEVEIPQGGLDLPDNCVGFVDSISVPSFPNIFIGKHRIYYRQAHKKGNIEFMSAGLSPEQYSLAGLAAALNSTLTFPLFINTTVTASDGADTLTLTMTGSPGITGVEGNWGNGGNVTNVSGFVYTNGTNNFEFTEWDAATDFGKMRRSHTKSLRSQSGRPTSVSTSAQTSGCNSSKSAKGVSVIRVCGPASSSTLQSFELTYTCSQMATGSCYNNGSPP